jgi:hypothetical protein
MAPDLSTKGENANVWATCQRCRTRGGYKSHKFNMVICDVCYFELNGAINDDRTGNERVDR